MRDEATSPPGQRAGLLTACYKNSEFPKLRVLQLQCKLTHTQQISGPQDLGARATDTNMLMLMLLIVLWVIKSFVSDPGVSRFLPGTKKQ